MVGGAVGSLEGLFVGWLDGDAEGGKDGTIMAGATGPRTARRSVPSLAALWASHSG